MGFRPNGFKFTAISDFGAALDGWLFHGSSMVLNKVERLTLGCKYVPLSRICNSDKRIVLRLQHAARAGG